MLMILRSHAFYCMLASLLAYNSCIALTTMFPRIVDRRLVQGRTWADGREA